jgi:hypothetical protein
VCGARIALCDDCIVDARDDTGATKRCDDDASLCDAEHCRESLGVLMQRLSQRHVPQTIAVKTPVPKTETIPMTPVFTSTAPATSAPFFSQAKSFVEQVLRSRLRVRYVTKRVAQNLVPVVAGSVAAVVLILIIVIIIVVVCMRARRRKAETASMLEVLLSE